MEFLRTTGAFQLQREAASTNSAIARALWCAGPSTQSAPQSIAGDGGGDGWKQHVPGSIFFMNKFRRLGFIEYKGEIHINDSLLSVVLHE
jgi:hypothetical protein